MPEKTYEMTAEGKKQLEEELQTLKFVKRPQIVEQNTTQPKMNKCGWKKESIPSPNN